MQWSAEIKSWKFGLIMITHCITNQTNYILAHSYSISFCLYMEKENLKLATKLKYLNKPTNHPTTTNQHE